MRPIYLLDDHALMRDGLRAVLVAGGRTVVGETDSPTQALADLKAAGAALLLLDLHLGQRSGLEVLSELQRRKLDVITVVLTMSAQPRHVAEALRLGARGYVLKGSASGELLNAIRTVEGGQRYLGHEVADLAVQGLTAEAQDEGAAALSARERQIVELVVRGRSSSEIGALLHLSPKTVDTYRSRLMAKLATPDVPALVRWAIRSGLIDVYDV